MPDFEKPTSPVVVSAPGARCQNAEHSGGWGTAQIWGRDHGRGDLRVVLIEGITGEVVTIDDGAQLVRFRHHQSALLGAYVEKYGRTVQLQGHGNSQRFIIGVKLDAQSVAAFIVFRDDGEALGPCEWRLDE